MRDHTKPTLVISSTGKTGRRVAERLEARGVPDAQRLAVRRIRRSTGRTGIHGRRALDGAGAAYVSYYPDIAIPGAVEAVTAFAESALEQGVRRLVLLSGRGEEEAQRAERALRESGADWTIVRCSWFSQNFSEGVFAEHGGDGRGRAAGHARSRSRSSTSTTSPTWRPRRWRRTATRARSTS